MSVHDPSLKVTPRLIQFETEEQLHDHAERLNQIGVSPDVPIMDANGTACLASRTAPGGDGWGFAYWMPNTDDGDLQTCDCENCGTEGRSREYNQWRPTFPVTGLVCFDLSGTEGLHP